MTVPTSPRPRMNDEQKALALLSLLAPWRAEQYGTWIMVGMALHSVNDNLCQAWDTWSQQSSKFKPGECERRWRSFKRGKGVSIGSLFQWAEEDSGGAAVQEALRLHDTSVSSALQQPPSNPPIVGMPTSLKPQKPSSNPRLPGSLIRWLGDNSRYQEFETLMANEERKIGGTHTRTDVYHDPNGEGVFCVARFDTGLKSKQFRPITSIGNRLVVRDPDGPLPLFQAHRLSRKSGIVFVGEGEKVVIALESVGFTATTTAHGAHAPARTDLSLLADRDVVIWPDNDGDGLSYANKLIELLGGVTPPPRVRLLDVSGFTHKWDAADFIEARRREGMSNEQIKEEIERFADEAEPVLLSQNHQPTPDAFPVEVFPEPIATFIRRAATAIGCAPAFVAAPLLAIFASLIGNTRRIQLKRGWTEPAVVWVALVGDSGTLKSPPLRLVLKPVHEMQAKEMRDHAEAMHVFKAEKKRYEIELKRWKASGAGDPPREPTLPPEP